MGVGGRGSGAGGWGIVLMALGLAACAVPPPVNRARVSSGIEQRIGRGLGPPPAPRPPAPRIPEGVSLADGLTEDEAVAVALWNNAALEADLAALGFARADVIEAGLLRNPVFSLLFPWGPKQLEATASWPVQALWERPRRVAAAKLDAERIAEGLVQNGLNLARDVRLSYSDLLLAQRRAELAAEAARLRGEIASLAEARLRAGDISELEAIAARSEARLGEEQAARAAREVPLAAERLRHLLGLAEDETPFDPKPDGAEPASFGDLRALVKDALAARPDLRAAELAIESAGARARWERSRILGFAAVLDINQQGKEGVEAGPGVGVDLPIFSRNQGGVARADAEMEHAARAYLAVRQRIVLQVREAHHQLAQAQEALEHWRQRILPGLEEASRLSQKAYSAGDVSYLLVLEATRQLQEARLREAEFAADLRRSFARLETGVGKRLAGQP